MPNNCKRLKKNLEKCKEKHPKECNYYKKILNMCLKRPKKIFISGP